jgi:hypothetical protein
MQAEDLDSIFMLPLSQQAFEELQQLLKDQMATREGGSE